MPFEQKKRALENSRAQRKNLATPYSSALLCAVPSAKKGLTSEFGMGSGISPSLLSPGKIYMENRFEI